MPAFGVALSPVPVDSHLIPPQFGHFICGGSEHPSHDGGERYGGGECSSALGDGRGGVDEIVGTHNGKCTSCSVGTDARCRAFFDAGSNPQLRNVSE